MKKLLYTLATAGVFALATTTLAQPGRRPDDKPGFPPQGGPAQPGFRPGDHRPAPPQPGPAPHHDVHKPAPHPVAPAPHPAPHPVPPAPHPVPHPAPHPVAPAPHPAPHPVPPPPHPHYRPGFKAYSLPKPFAVEYYREWVRPTHKQYFTLFSMPDTMQLRLWPGQVFEIKLQEERKEGYTWFARYDAYYVDVDVDHEKGHRNIFGHRDRYAEIEIKGKRPGASMVELIYANRVGWDNGDAPEKVIQIFVLTE